MFLDTTLLPSYVSQNTYLFMELCDKGELKSLVDSRQLSEQVTLLNTHIHIYRLQRDMYTHTTIQSTDTQTHTHTHIQRDIYTHNHTEYTHTDTYT